MLENAFFVKKWPKIEKKSRFFHFNHFCWQNWEYIQHNRSQNKREGYFLISSKFDPIFKICQGCKIFWIFFNFPFPWSKMVLHTNFQTYRAPKLRSLLAKKVVWLNFLFQILCNTTLTPFQEINASRLIYFFIFSLLLTKTWWVLWSKLDHFCIIYIFLIFYLHFQWF